MRGLGVRVDCINLSTEVSTELGLSDECIKLKPYFMLNLRRTKRLIVGLLSLKFCCPPLPAPHLENTSLAFVARNYNLG